MAESKKPEVRIVLAETHRIKAGDKLFVTVGPEFADFCDEISEALRWLGAEAVVFPLPKDSVQFFAIEQAVRVELAPGIVSAKENNEKNL